MLEGICEAAQKHGIKLYCIASDGESKRGLALNLMTLKKPLSSTTPLFSLIGTLSLFNILVGPNDLTSDKDFRHIFKRGRNVLLRNKGVNIDGQIINIAILRQHFSDYGITPARMDALLNPNDKQDVPLAVSLLLAISNLPQPSETHLPTYTCTRRLINLLGEFFSSLVLPYITPSANLSEQLTLLSKAVHLSLALYSLARGGFIPVQLYTDIAIMVKNAYFCVAKTQLDNPNAEFHLTLLGTDRLESQFGNLRTMVGNDSNADLLQIGSRLTAAAECSSILTQHPEWNTNPRRLQLSSISEKGDILNNSIDHVNPDRWTGNVSVSDVDLKTTWYQGRRKAEEALIKAGISSPFDSMDKTGNIDILAPFGVLILKNGLEAGEENEEEDIVSSWHNKQLCRLSSFQLNQQTPELLNTSLSTHPPLDEELDPDLEDLISTEDIPSQSHDGRMKNPHFLVLDGKSVHKASILRLYSHPLTMPGPSSTDRLKRVRGYKRFDGPVVNQFENGTILGESSLLINDPALTLVKVNGTEIFLAAIQVSGLKEDGRNLTSVPLDQLQNATNIRVSFQILKLLACEPFGGSQCDWICDGSTVKFGIDYDILEAVGTMVQSFNPIIDHMGDSLPKLCFSSEELKTITLILHERLENSPELHIPSAKMNDFFPYRINGIKLQVGSLFTITNKTFKAVLASFVNNMKTSH